MGPCGARRGAVRGRARARAAGRGAGAGRNEVEAGREAWVLCVGRGRTRQPREHVGEQVRSRLGAG